MSNAIMGPGFVPTQRLHTQSQNQTQQTQTRGFDFSTSHAQNMLREANERIISMNIVLDGWNRFLQGKLLPQ